MSQCLVCLYLENVLKKENNELNELSECMLYKMLAFSERMSQNCKTTFYKTFLENLTCFVIKVSKTFQKLLACFALKVSKTFHKTTCLLALKVSKNFSYYACFKIF